MKLDKLKKKIQFRMCDLYSPEGIAARFSLCNDDNELTCRINKRDESALLQFTLKHINVLKKWIIKRHNTPNAYRLIDGYLPYFVVQIKMFAEKYKDEKLPENWLLQFENLGFKQFPEFAKHLNEMIYNAWRGFEITSRDVDFLNNLNDFLANAEEKIIERAKIEIPLLEERLKNANGQTSDYEYFVDISYYSKNSVGNPIYEARHSFNILSVKENNWGLLCDGEDWRESGWMPELKSRCCYLMHELVYHSHIYHEIFEIEGIWIDTKLWNQSMYSYKNDGWEIGKFTEAD